MSLLQASQQGRGATWSLGVEDILLECRLSRRDCETVLTEFSSGALSGKVRRDGVRPAATFGSAPRDLVLLPDISKGRLH
jgi:hypothetical protein